MSSRTTPAREILASMHLRGPVAVWVLLAHAYALLVPLALVWVVVAHWDYLVTTTYNPYLFFVAACLLSAGGAFEAAQNTMDNWYLTPDSPSAGGVGLCDLLFYFLVTAGQAVSAIAIAGDRWWVVVVAVSAAVALPPVYLLGGPYYAPMSVSSLLAIGLAFQAFGDPIVWLQLLMVAATMYFFGGLVRTQAQVLHGFTTVSASSGVWFLVWAIAAGSRGGQTGWVALLAVTVLAVAVGVLLRPAVYRLPATPRAVTITA